MRHLLGAYDLHRDRLYGHPSTRTDPRVGDWANDDNVEGGLVRFCAGRLKRIDARFTAVRCFALDGWCAAGHSSRSSGIARWGRAWWAGGGPAWASTPT